MRVRGKIRNFGAEVRTAGMGVAMSFRRPRFVTSVIIAFVIFGTLMSLLSAGTAGVQMVFSGSLNAAASVISKAFLALFGVGMGFIDWLSIFTVSLLQAITIGLVIEVWKNRGRAKTKVKKRRNIKGVEEAKTTKKAKKNDENNADNVERAGIAAGLAVLGSGCPTCGTTLLMPVVTATVGSGGMALASAISGALTAGAVIILLWSMKSLGQEAYTLIIEEEFKKGEK